MSSPSPPPAVTQQIQKTEIPAWVSKAGQENYAFAKNIAARPFVQYGGDRVANLSPNERYATNVVSNAQKFAQGGYEQALEATQAGMNFQPQRVDVPQGYDPMQARSFLTNAPISQYMDPEVQNVINPAVEAIRREGRMAEQGAADQAIGLGGVRSGSRFEVGKAVRGAEVARAVGATEAGLRGAAFERAAGRAGQDIQTGTQIDLANQQARITETAQRLQAQGMNAQQAAEAARISVQGGQAAAGIAQQAGQTGLQTGGFMAGMGATERGIRQQELDVNYQNFLARQGEGEKDLNLRMTALGMTPYDKTTSGTTTQTTPTTSNPWMTGIGAAATFLPMFFSDRKVKKGIKRVGVDEGGLNVYEFEYKKGFANDNKKHVGFMADDVEKKAPGNVHKTFVNGEPVKAVDYAGAMRDTRDDKGKRRVKYKKRRKSQPSSGSFMIA